MNGDILTYSQNKSTKTELNFVYRPIGAWKISDNFFIEIKKKPNWWIRFWAKLLLGWIYERR